MTPLPLYLDYAATSALRPPSVGEAVRAYLTDVGATPGRAGHSRALEAGRLVLRCRRAIARLLGIEGDPARLVFQMNATHALNTALFGLVKPGDVVVRTAYDHNSVRRPVAALAERGAEERVLTGRPDGGVDLDELRDLLSGPGRQPRLLTLPHVSNVTGVEFPVRQMAELAHEAGALVLLDAAQSVGHRPVDVSDLGVDLLAFTGHKGLLGPQGVGGLWVREGLQLAPLLYGGTGSQSEDTAMPAALPDRLEAGSQNAPGIAGLLAGVEWVVAEGIPKLHEREMALKAELVSSLAALPNVDVRSPAAPGGGAIVMLTCPAVAPAELAWRLESEHGIEARAGLHCAPGAHEAIGTLATGALRLSIGWATTAVDIRRVVEALARITHSM
ncbi:aminotransferase class V-fold PLP-dependent enzyme [soil metagenome]